MKNRPSPIAHRLACLAFALCSPALAQEPNAVENTTQENTLALPQSTESKEPSEPDQNPSAGVATPQMAELKKLVQERFQKDRKAYTPEQFKELEELYQTANKQWNSPEAKAALKELIEKYPQANRTGCALLYLGQMSTGQERADYLKLAIQNYSDCFYGNGVQVGPLARAYLAVHYGYLGKFDEAKALCDEIQRDYPNALRHDGKPLALAFEHPMTTPLVTPQIAKLKALRTERFDRDRKTYTPEQCKEIEALYQTANQHWLSPEARESLKKVIAQYPQSNRAGCALLYLGQMSSGQEQEDYLKQAIQNHSDCFYGDGVQVGAFARYCLAKYYSEIGKLDAAKALCEEIRKDYPDAIQHGTGKPLVESLDGLFNKTGA